MLPRGNSCMKNVDHGELVRNIVIDIHFNIKVKNYNLNVTEVRYPDFKKRFHGIFNFTIGILTRVLPW